MTIDLERLKSLIFLIIYCTVNILNIIFVGLTKNTPNYMFYVRNTKMI